MQTTNIKKFQEAFQKAGEAIRFADFFNNDSCKNDSIRGLLRIRTQDSQRYGRGSDESHFHVGLASP
jgi:hypothetical protein